MHHLSTGESALEQSYHCHLAPANLLERLSHCMSGIQSTHLPSMEDTFQLLVHSCKSFSKLTLHTVVVGANDCEYGRLASCVCRLLSLQSASILMYDLPVSEYKRKRSLVCSAIFMKINGRVLIKRLGKIQDKQHEVGIVD